MISTTQEAPSKAKTRKTVATAPLTEEQRRLAEEHYWRVEAAAKKYGKLWVSYDERLGYGAEGLVDAAATYRPECGPFGLWADRRIFAAIHDATRCYKTALVRIPRTQSGKVDQSALGNASRLMSLSRPTYGGAKRETFADIVPDRGAPEKPFDGEMLWHAVRSLGERNASVVTMYHRDGLKQKEIADRLGLADSRVSQILSQAYSELRTNPQVLEAVAC